MADQREMTGGRFVLAINGESAGFVKKFSGFAMEADIVANDVGPDIVQRKQVANTKWTPGKAAIGIGMGNELYQWIKAAFDQGAVTRSGSLTTADFNYKATWVWAFQDALITSLTVPKLDGSSKEAGYFDFEFEAEQVRWSPGGGADVRDKAGPNARQRPWLCSNFRVEMGGLPCNRVASVDALTWTCAVASDVPGSVRRAGKRQAKVTVPDIKLSISMADFGPWAESARRWFVDGQHLDENEMQGRIVFLDSNMKDELGAIDLIKCGFKRFAQDDLEANSEKVARFNVDLYVEKMGFTLNGLDARR